MVTLSAVLALCPSCPTAIEARALAFSEGFWVNAWYALLPFVIAGIAVRRFVRHLDRRVDRRVDAEHQLDA